MDVLSSTVSMGIFALIIAETVIGVRARTAVKGSKQRYVLLTQRRILSWAVNIGFAVQGIVGMVLGQPFSTISLLLAVWLSYQEIKNHKDDDDWFNGRMKKIAKGLKRAFAPPIKAPTPVAAPSPVFG